MIKINSITEIGLAHYITARIDIKNKGTSENKIKFLYCSDKESLITFPNWFSQDDGVGGVVQSYNGFLNLKIKCINDGKLSIRLGGIDVKDENGNKLHIYINFLKASVNGVPLLNESKLVSHDDYYQCEEIEVLHDDILLIHLEWSPFMFNLINNSLEFFYSNNSSNLIKIESTDSYGNNVLFNSKSEENFIEESPKISVIIPVFNPGKLLYDCLDSVVGQTLKEIEIICVDDGSTDGSFDVLKEYAKTDKRFKIFQQKNKGAGSARNKAIDESSGEFIIFLDSDDWIESDMCEKLYVHAKKLDVDLVIFDALWHTKEGIEPFNYFSKNEFNEDYTEFTFDYNFIKNRLLIASYGVIWSRLYKSKYIKENKIRFPKHKIYNDVEFCFKTAILANNIAYFPKPFYNYIKLGQPSLQTSFREGKDELIWFDVLQGLYNIIIECNLMDEWRLDFINYCIFYSFEKLKNIDIKLQSDFLDKLKEFFKILNPSDSELTSIKNLNLTWYTKSTLNYLPLYYEVMSVSNEKIKLKLFKIKLNEFKNQLEETPLDLKEDVYEHLRKWVHSFDLNIDVGKKLSVELNNFYNSIIKSKNYSEFSYVYLTYNCAEKFELWQDINNSKDLSNYSIYHGQPGELNLIDDYKELKVLKKDPVVVRTFSSLLRGNLEIIFEIKVTDYANVGLSSSNDVLKFTFLRISNKNWLYYRLIRVNDFMRAYVSEDGINWQIINFTGTTLDDDECQFQFNCGYSNERDKRIMIRNIKIYSLQV